ncbi:dicarboxylate/amino acid:cation symporter [Auritidibacter ignavus]|uniref:dicarboxylate/amino acid:cation symporter n=1 Tax=Auritidibacter ignavus TaxID=678932 RepID=UPI0024B91657|nr:dicarboxylate/amino acid:cation symporter [Auritidibacter ignavus]WHS35825.1 dicarboxylate/amino acid:cation symporter [Auritidibacter ignavus]
MMSTKKSWWRRYLDFPLIWKLAIALLAGVIVGLVWGEGATVLEPFGEIFLRLLNMLVIPLIVATLIVGITSVTPQKLGRIGGKIFIYYLLSTCFAISIGLGLALLVHPGSGLSAPENATQQGEEAPPLADVFVNIFPENIFQALAEGDILAIMFVVLIVGFALAYLIDSHNESIRDGALTIRKICVTGQEILFLIIRGVLEYSPLGVFALIAVAIGDIGVSALVPLGQLILVIFGAVVIMLVLYAVFILVMRRSPLEFFKAAKEPMLTGFVTRSSSGTLPVSSRAAEKLGIPQSTYSLTLPLGATINMDGTAIYVGASVVFVADAMGTTLSATEIISVILVGVLASIGTAGVPGAGIIMLTMAVNTAGLSMAPVALVAGIDAILDMARTMNNITGDLAGTVGVDASEKRREQKKTRATQDA